MQTVEEVLADRANMAIVTNADEAILLNWFTMSGKPETIIEMRFGNVWVPIQCDVQGLDFTVGRDQTDQPVEAGRAVIRLDNRSGRFTDWQGQQPPINEATQVRVIVQHPLVSDIGRVCIFWGWVQEWEQEWTRSSDVVVINAVDVIALL
jgi:hypothetical protein